MKNLLSMLAVSTLVGTSASSLQPVFTNNVVNHGFQSNQISNKDISITNENDTNPFISRIINIDTNERVTCSITQNGIIYVGTASGKGSLSTSKLYKSTDGIKFIEIKSWNQDYGKSDTIKSLAIDNENNIYVGTYNNVFKSIIGADHFFALIGVRGIVECLAVTNNNTVYASTSYGLYKSTDGTSFSNDDIQGNVKKIQNKIVTIASNGTIWVGTHDGLWKSTDGTNFENLSSLKTNSIWNIAIAPNGTIWVGTTKGLYKSTDGTSFSNDDIQGNVKKIQIFNIAMTNDNNIYIGTIAGLYKSNNGTDFELVNIKTGTSNEIRSLAIINNTIYVGTYNKGLYAINLIEQLIKINKPDTFDKSWPLYNGIVYSSTQKIDIKDNLVASATLDGKSITIPTTNLDIPIGEHNLILTLKDKTLATIFGGDTLTGQVTYKLWVKTLIDKNQIDYQTKIDDTQLYNGLVSNFGNTNNADIIQTKIKDGTGTHDASLNIDFKDILIDFDVNKSFYVQGTVDETTNNFTATGSKQKITKNLEIKIDGTYHLHLVDTVGNNYNSYLELGESNWKLKGTFDDSELDKLKSKLNVTVNLTDPSQKSKALGWLHQYENFVENKFNETIKTNGKGFDSEIKNQITSYTSFLKPLTYDIANEPKFTDGLDKSALVKTIIDKANEILNKGLDELPKNLNVNTSNVVNKSTL
ncbi:MAG: hypothetical protein H9Q67_01940, partial [Spiroplasma ixodetis]|nr:hypothetical protein [Spiroplasma ixodetis]